MRSFLVGLACFVAAAWPAQAAPDSDPVLLQGLQAMESQTNGVQAACQIWYQDQPELAAAMQKHIYNVSADMGAVIGSEIVASQRLSSRSERFYGVIFFERRPLWFSIERYVGREMGKDKPTFLTLRVAREPDDILPALAADVHT
jgi:hypothetical protein